MTQDRPILILQMQRMGDLVLTFPLVGWLQAILPGKSVWVVGEKKFFDGLVGVSPQATYFDYSEGDKLKGVRYSMVLNLSHRPEAARLAAGLDCDQLFGAYTDQDGKTRIRGDWQLYRASVTHNNRHNLYHWADLNGMDVTSTRVLNRTIWPPARQPGKTAGRVGLFVGASEESKRPAPEFWAALAGRLLKKGLKPVFLGGTGDKPLGERAAAIINSPALNLCGKFSVHELCLFMGELDLLITPDTGPMHLGVWLGAPTLNLSLGPVNPWETGPFAPGHHVLQAAISCAGCWSCRHPGQLCREKITPAAVAAYALGILEGAGAEKSLLPGGAKSWVTRRDRFGLHELRGLGTNTPRYGRSMFWKLFFGKILGRFGDDEVAGAIASCASHMRDCGLENRPRLAGEKLLRDIAPVLKHSSPVLGDDFWLSSPPFLRPLSSYVQFMLQNSLFSRQAKSQALQYVEYFLSLVS